MRRFSPTIGALVLAGALVAPVWGAGPAAAAPCAPSGHPGAPGQPSKPGGTGSQPGPGVPAPIPTPETPASVLVGVLEGYLNPCPAG